MQGAQKLLFLGLSQFTWDIPSKGKQAFEGGFRFWDTRAQSQFFNNDRDESEHQERSGLLLSGVQPCHLQPAPPPTQPTPSTKTISPVTARKCHQC